MCHQDTILANECFVMSLDVYRCCHSSNSSTKSDKYTILKQALSTAINNVLTVAQYLQL